MHPCRHAVAAEQHDAEESGFEEKCREHLIAQQRSGYVARSVHKAGPVGAELETHRYAGNNAQRKRQGEYFYPQSVGRVAPGIIEEFDAYAQIKQYPRERDGDAGKKDMKTDVEPELGARKYQRVRRHDDSR